MEFPEFYGKGKYRRICPLCKQVVESKVELIYRHLRREHQMLVVIAKKLVEIFPTEPGKAKKGKGVKSCIVSGVGYSIIGEYR